MTQRWPIRRLATGVLLSSAGSWAAGIAVSYYVFRQTGSAVWVAGTLFFTFGVVGLFSPLAGKIADRYDRRLVMIVADLGLRAPHNIEIASSEGRYYVDFDVEYPSGKSFVEAHDLSSEVEERIRRTVPSMEKVTIHMEELQEESTESVEATGTAIRLLREIVECVRSDRRVLGCSDVTLLDVGSKFNLSLACKFGKDKPLAEVHQIINELAEQTNILAINATIEAAGASEAGRRFAAVAEEIRKLADRVASSTKDIRGLVDEVRSAVNTTVMATESGSKTVEAGARQFAEVAAAFAQIAGLVSTTTEAAREIELSTKQQSTAVEQVNLAIANVAQATRESEASSGQTLQTASQLAEMSRGLARLVQKEAA